MYLLAFTADNPVVSIFTPSKSEVQDAIGLVDEYIDNTTILSEPYNLQAVGFKNKEGDRMIWLNFFSDSEINKPDKEILFVLGGGSAFFNSLINLSTKKVIDFMVNGES